jgi:3',5'-cyclic AMP phosphodiesterase CpdA
METMMKRIVHMSDLHLSTDPEAQERQKDIFDGMFRALQETAAGNGDGHSGVDLLVITGDLFDSSTLEVEKAVEVVTSWYSLVTAAIGRRSVPTVIVPGNHDVRGAGVKGPHSVELFDALRKELSTEAKITVQGFDAQCPILISRLPPDAYGLPAELLMVDSTYLAEGWFSAGGLIRQVDLLHVASKLQARKPLIVLTHHHLIPTTLTDIGAIDVRGQMLPVSLMVKHLLPRLVANADHEELTMTAFGAGTALSTLQTLGRPVLVLHGHKHCPCVRLLRAVHEEQGDVLLAAAGSAGRAEPWQATKQADKALWPLWPSFNIVDIDDTALRITALAYPYDRHRDRKPVSRLLIKAQCHTDEGEWRVQFDERPCPGSSGPRLVSNHAGFRLEGAGPNTPRWNAIVERTLTASPTFSEPYVESVEGAPKAYLDEVAVKKPPESNECPTRVEIEIGKLNRYRLIGGLCGTFSEARICYGDRTAPYDWVDLFNRFHCKEAKLVLRGFPDAMDDRPFGSIVDLTTGIEKPSKLEHKEDGDYVLLMENCPARTLLRIFWPLARG